MGSERRRRKAERPKEILDAAFEEFCLNGFVGTRLDDIAARAKITKGTIYLYFESKEDLFLAVLTEEKRPVFDKIVALAQDPQGSALSIFKEHFEYVADQMEVNRPAREAVRLMFAEGYRYPTIVDRWYAEVLEPSQEAVRKIVQYGIDRGEFRPDALDYFPQLYMSPAFYAVNWLNLFDCRVKFDSRRFMADAFQMLVRCLMPANDGTAGVEIKGRKRASRTDR